MYLQLKSLFEHATGLRVYRGGMPWGIDLANDLRRLGIHAKIRTVFDVGANVGQTALRFRKAFPLAKIHSFEPVTRTFNALQENLASVRGVVTHQLAFGSANEARAILLASSSDLSSFHNTGWGRSSLTGATEQVRVARIDDFCESVAIENVDLLKVDAEGHDLEVLKGAERMFSAGKIVAALVEVVLCPSENRVPLDDFVGFLCKFEYSCVGIYDQAWWGSKRLHYGNALFVRDTYLE